MIVYKGINRLGKIVDKGKKIIIEMTCQEGKITILLDEKIAEHLRTKYNSPRISYLVAQLRAETLSFVIE